MQTKKTVLIASGSRHSIPPVKNSPGVARIIHTLTKENTNNFNFVVLSKYDKNLEDISFDKNKYLHPKPTLKTFFFEWILKHAPYRWKKQKYSMSQPDRIVYYSNLVSKAKKVNPEIVITFMHIELFKMLQKALPNAKHVFFYRSTDLNGRIGRENIQFILNNSAGFLANTKDPILELKAMSPTINFPTETIYNAVPKVILSLEEQKNIGIAYRAKFGLKENDFVLGYAGRFSEEKSLKEIFKAIKKLKDQNSIVHLIIAGDINNEKTPNYKYYNELMTYKNTFIKDQIHLAGWITNSELFHFYCSIDLGILLSKYREGNSMFLIEAMSYGVPVIATAVGGNKEIIKTNFNGVLIEKNTIEKELSLQIEALVSDNESYNVMSKNALNFVEENHSESNMKNKFLNFVNKI